MDRIDKAIGKRVVNPWQVRVALPLFVIASSGALALDSCGVTCDDGTSCSVASIPPSPPVEKSVAVSAVRDEISPFTMRYTRRMAVPGGVVRMTQDLIGLADELLEMESNDPVVKSAMFELDRARSTGNSTNILAALDGLRSAIAVRPVPEIERALNKVSCSCIGVDSGGQAICHA